MAAPLAPTTPLSVTHYLTENSAYIAKYAKYKAFALNVLEKISWVAMIAIVATALTIYYSGAVLTGASALGMAGAIIFTPIMIGIGSKCGSMAQFYSKQAVVESKVVEHLEKIAHWKQRKIERFMRGQGLDPAQVPLDALKPLNAEEPLRALLPLIARFKYLKETAEEIERTANLCMNEEFANVENEDQRLFNRYISRQNGTELHEFQAIPTAFNAAVLLQMIQTPTEKLEIEAPHPKIQTKIPNIGICRAKSDYGRLLARHVEPLNDDYFVFHPDLHRPPITLTEIEQDMTPQALRLKLFPNRV